MTSLSVGVGGRRCLSRDEGALWEKDHPSPGMGLAQKHQGVAPAGASGDMQVQRRKRGALEASERASRGFHGVCV